MTSAPLMLYNSLSRAIERITPIDPASIRVYSCGPTVYHYAHIGNLRAYVFTDTLSRTLTWKASAMGWGPLTHVINITDVGHLTSDADAGDDKMEARARETGRDIWSIAAHYTAAFKRNVAELNIRPPTHFPLATDHVAGMIAWGEAIADRHCYRLPDGLYFDTATVPDYGALAGSQGDVRESRIGDTDGKRQPADFAIWRASPAGEQRQMEWDSPWGRGAPGWHLECSVMSRQYLGDRFDIHTGGIDHREIHHPNEIAQNQAMSGTADTGAAFWMHNNFVVQRAGKMSKSDGEFLTLDVLAEHGFHPLAYRLMCLQAHYRSELEFSWEGLAAAQVRLRRTAKHVEGLRASVTGRYQTMKRFNDAEGNFSWQLALEYGSAGLQRYVNLFDHAISDDLGTPEALTIWEAAIKDRVLSSGEKYVAFKIFSKVLGFDKHSFSRRTLRSKPPAETELKVTEVEALIKTRIVLKRRKMFQESDTLRSILEQNGVDVMDGDPLGWDWRRSL